MIKSLTPHASSNIAEIYLQMIFAAKSIGLSFNLCFLSSLGICTEYWLRIKILGFLRMKAATRVEILVSDITTSGANADICLTSPISWRMKPHNPTVTPFCLIVIFASILPSSQLRITSHPGIWHQTGLQTTLVEKLLRVEAFVYRDLGQEQPSCSNCLY